MKNSKQALIKLTFQLEKKLTYSDSIQPVQLPSSGRKIPAGIEGLVTGWGKLYENVSEGHLCLAVRYIYV